MCLNSNGPSDEFSINVGSVTISLAVTVSAPKVQFIVNGVSASLTVSRIRVLANA